MILDAVWQNLLQNSPSSRKSWSAVSCFTIRYAQIYHPQIWLTTSAKKLHIGGCKNSFFCFLHNHLYVDIDIFHSANIPYNPNTQCRRIAFLALSAANLALALHKAFAEKFLAIYWHNNISWWKLIQIDPFFPFGTGRVQVCDLAVFYERTFAIFEIMPINENVLLFSAVVRNFPAVAIPELTGGTNFLHFGAAENRIWCFSHD